MDVIGLLLAAVAASRVPVVVLLAAVQGGRPYRRIRAALPVLLLLERGALGLRNVGAKLRASVPLIDAHLLLLHVPLVLLQDLAGSLDVAGARCDLARLLEAVSH